MKHLQSLKTRKAQENLMNVSFGLVLAVANEPVPVTRKIKVTGDLKLQLSRRTGTLVST